MISIIRHSHTEYNIKGELGRFCGSSDPPLSERGIQESIKIGEYLSDFKFKYIITSPLIRAYQTAKIISSYLNLPITIEKDFREIDYGLWEGLTKYEIISKYKEDYLSFEREPFSFVPNKGEKPSDALTRYMDSFYKQRDDSIIITHKTVTRLFLCSIGKINFNEYRNFLDLKLGSITLISSINDPNILELNFISHLK
jgi:phosphoserine phosphatase